MTHTESALLDATVIANGMRLHMTESGQGDVVLLLHGFPEFWYSWRHQISALAASGFRAVAPDLRGYNTSDRPKEVANYRTNVLVQDVVALIKQLACGPIYLVGHDWGGLLAWRLAAQHPDLVRKLVVLNAAHPLAYRRELRRNPMQWLRSYYVLLFQIPWLPENLLRARNFSALDRAWRQQPVHPNAFSSQDIEEYKKALRAGGLSGPLNYYRAAFRYSEDLFGQPQRILKPTMVIWGEHDPFMSVSVNEDLAQWVPDLVVNTIPDASHWVQNDAPERVNTLLIDFFRSAEEGRVKVKPA